MTPAGRSRPTEAPMATESETARNNLLAWAALTDLCLTLRRAVLMATLSPDEADRRVFEEIRELKEARWRMSGS